jgi:hypothetical protein
VLEVVASTSLFCELKPIADNMLSRAFRGLWGVLRDVGAIRGGIADSRGPSTALLASCPLLLNEGFRASRALSRSRTETLVSAARGVPAAATEVVVGMVAAEAGTGC